ncbi:translation initiation factor IF-3, partial [Pantoea sp. SIMBA_079]
MRNDKRAVPKAPINENISAREVRLIGADGEQVGIVSIDEALRIADEAKLDLV